MLLDERSREDGMSLVEMMIAVLVMSVALSALAATFFSSLRSIESQRVVSGATRVGSTELERARAIDYGALATGTTTTTDSELGRTYDVTRTITEVDVDPGNAIATDLVKEVALTVSWTLEGQTNSAQFATSIARPGDGTGGTTSGPAIGDVSVAPSSVTVNSTGNPSTSVAVTVPVSGLTFGDVVTLTWSDDAGPHTRTATWTSGESVTFTIPPGDIKRAIAVDTTALVTFSAEVSSLTKSATLTVQRPSGTLVTIGTVQITPDPITVGAAHKTQGCNGSRCENTGPVTFTVFVSGLNTSVDEDSVRVSIPLEGGGVHELALVRDTTDLTKWTAGLAAYQLKIDGPDSGIDFTTFTFTAIRVADDVQDSKSVEHRVARAT